MGINLVQRLVFDGALLVSIFLLPWWVTISLAVIVAFLFTAPEIIIAGFLVDVLHATPLEGFFGFEYIFTVFFVIMFVVAGGLKKSLLSYS